VYASCSFNLNDNYTGGDFAWFRGQHKIKLGAGDAIIWPADYFWVHEVEPILSGTRYSTNSFIQELPECLKLELYKARHHLESNIPTIPNVIDQFRAKYHVPDIKGVS
jgi:predicted 2-oxoglutarate/Fe(II)-dependent dioxygenase YbiX